MPCFSPLTAYRPPVGSSDGRLIFCPSGADLSAKKAFFTKYGAPLKVPCGKCVGCRVEYSRIWAIRCMHEASMYDDNCFITLTYKDMPEGGSLVKSDLQLFMKRLREFARRRSGRKIRFYACGEYGDLEGRPHYHILVFNFDFKDKKLWRTTQSGHKLYRSEDLEQLWPNGISEIGAVTFQSAGYVARYVVKKISGPRAAEHYSRLDPDGRIYSILPEFGCMSLKPGIGVPWLEKFHSDVYNFDFVLMNGKRLRPPRYYDVKMAFMYPSEFELTNFDRFRKDWLSFRRVRADNTPERLAVKSEIASAGLALSKRSL